MYTKIRAVVFTLLVMMSFIPAAQAQGVAKSVPAKIGAFGSWTAYSFNEGKGIVCYMAAAPAKAQGKYSKRDDVFALITHRPAENSKNVFTYIAGYTYKAGSEVTVTIDGKKFVLFTNDTTAWTPDDSTDIRLMEAIRKGSTMVVKGVSKRGTQTTDTFSLKGSGDAQDAIGQACGV